MYPKAGFCKENIERGKLMKMFFELLQVAIGHRVSLSRTLTIEEWSDIYEMSLKQTIAGVMFSGVERLSEQQRPPRKSF